MPKHAKHLDQIEQAISIKYNNRVYEMKEEGQDVVVLSLGEAFFDIPLHSFCELPFPAAFHYSHSRGLMELREKLAKYYERGAPGRSRSPNRMPGHRRVEARYSYFTHDDSRPRRRGHPLRACLGELLRTSEALSGSTANSSLHGGPTRCREVHHRKNAGHIVNNPNNPSGRDPHSEGDAFSARSRKTA